MRRFPALLCVAGLAAAPASAVAGPSTKSQTVQKFEWSAAKGRLGVMVTSLTPELRKHFGAAEDRGVLVAHVESGTPAAAAGIQVGDVIVEVHGKKIDAASDVLSALADVRAGQHAEVTLLRDRKPRTLDATLADDAVVDIWSQPWLRDWMKPLDAPRSFDESWLRKWMKPLDPAQSQSSFFDKLRELFAPKDEHRS